MRHNPTTIQELKSLRKPIRNINAEHYQKLNRLERMALFVTEHVGTMGFFMLIFVWTMSWLSWNTLAPVELRFDAYPAFELWLFISNMIQISLMPLIMVGQNLQAKHAESRAAADFEVNMKSERELETILQHLENQNELTLKILDYLEKDKK